MNPFLPQVLLRCPEIKLAGMGRWWEPAPGRQKAGKATVLLFVLLARCSGPPLAHGPERRKSGRRQKDQGDGSRPMRGNGRAGKPAEDNFGSSASGFRPDCRIHFVTPKEPFFKISPASFSW